MKDLIYNKHHLVDSFDYKKQEENIEKIYQNWLEDADVEIEKLAKSKDFLKLISNHFDLVSELHKNIKSFVFQYDELHKQSDRIFKNLYSFISYFKDFDLSSFETEYTKGSVRLLHFNGSETVSKNERSSVLIVYATINRFHILDIYQNKSVIKSLLSNGLDVYVLDWGYPNSFEEISLCDYIDYVNDAVQYIKSKDKQVVKEIERPPVKDYDTNRILVDNKDQYKKEDRKKISLMGYCWGGLIALIYVSLYDKEIKNLTLMASPIDFSKDTTTLSIWAKSIDIDKYINEFDHLDGQIIDIGFILRNPIRNSFDKYLALSKKYNDKDYIKMFISVERWLYDTPLIPGKFLKQIINDFYKNNLLIKNKIKINDKDVKLDKVTVPLLTIVADKDDLVSPESTVAINNLVSSKEKKTIRTSGGHVALCISKAAHQKLWPEVAEWILTKQ